jgi:hypothetical protein
MPSLNLSPKKVIITDYIIFSSLMFILICMAIIIFSSRDMSISGLAGAAMIIAVIVAIFRYIRVMAILNDNQMEDAIVTGIYSHRGMTRISFCFNYHGDYYRTNFKVLSSSAAKGLIPGTNIHVLVDSSQPKKALIAELFSRDQTEYQGQID